MIDAADFEERFESYVDRSGGPDACHPFMGGRRKSGYGKFNIGRRADGTRRCVSAHRVAFLLVHGRWPMPKGLHSCDNPPCCNARHIREGTQAQNVADMIARGRHLSRRCPERVARGERGGGAKLTEQDVRDIRANYALCRVTHKELAARFGVTPTNISQIITGKTWAHV